jgi:carboxypeptidase C (cathepsin A)
VQGGPGCSGIWSVFEEHGPYHIQPNFTLTLNSLSWNSYANMIYVDAPCGVGFSYSNTTEGLNTNDNQTAQDNYNFLQGFFSEFPEFSTNKFFITGESYAGVYVPTLSSLILSGPDTQLRSAFSGIMVGNPVINCPEILVSGPAIYVDNYYYHGLVSYLDRKNFYDNGNPILTESNIFTLY